MAALLGDIYEDLRFLEVSLHRIVRASLIREFGAADSRWWRSGVPLPVRQNCQGRREEDEDPCEDPFAYTDLADLIGVIDKQWSCVARSLPKAWRSDRKVLLEDLRRLNRIRRMVMHPVRVDGLPSEEDMAFIRRIRRELEVWLTATPNATQEEMAPTTN